MVCLIIFIFIDIWSDSYLVFEYIICPKWALNLKLNVARPRILLLFHVEKQIMKLT